MVTLLANAGAALIRFYINAVGAVHGVAPVPGNFISFWLARCFAVRCQGVKRTHGGRWFGKAFRAQGNAGGAAEQ